MKRCRCSRVHNCAEPDTRTIRASVPSAVSSCPLACVGSWAAIFVNTVTFLLILSPRIGRCTCLSLGSNGEAAGKVFPSFQSSRHSLQQQRDTAGFHQMPKIQQQRVALLQTLRQPAHQAQVNTRAPETALAHPRCWA